MTKKHKKVLYIVLGSIAGVAAVTLGIFYWIKPTETVAFLNTCWDWANRPLPVVGVSAVFIAIIVYKLFISTSFGQKKINELKNELKQVKEELSVVKTALDEEKETREKGESLIQKKQVGISRFIYRIRDAIPNRKVREIEETEDEETEEEVNNETTTD